MDGERRSCLQLRFGVAQRQNGAHDVQQGIGVRLLPGNGGCVRRRVDGQIQAVRVPGGEAKIRAAIPLHRRAAAGAEVAAFFCRQLDVPHADLVAVIEERRARQREQKCVGQLQFVRLEIRARAHRVVVARQKAEQPVVPGGGVVLQILLYERNDRRAGIAFEIALVLAAHLAVARAVISAQQRVIGRDLVVQAEIHVEARLQRTLRVAPLGQQRRLGIFRVQHRAHVAPDGAGAKLLVVILYKAACHIHTEAVAALIQPEAHHVLHRLARGKACGMVHRQLPWPFHLVKAVVQRGLAFEKA